MDLLRRMFTHLGWADERVLASLRQAHPLPPDALTLFAHVLGSEHVWLARLHERSPAVAIWPSLTLDDCVALARENREGYDALLDQLDEPAMQDEVSYVNSAGLAFRSTREDILTHVALHGMYHRGQVARALRQAGAAPSPTDYIAFVRGAPAATRDRR
ncbi:MAG TPA: DinB family protein [Gemmatimonadaceae bacterium]|nr:DinB family protein [Gemmatimonadaceae bacterium]